MGKKLGVVGLKLGQPSQIRANHHTTPPYYWCGGVVWCRAHTIEGVGLEVSAARLRLVPRELVDFAEPSGTSVHDIDQAVAKSI